MTELIGAAERRAGNLAGAIELITQVVKSKPADTAMRMLLAEHLMLNGDLDRADKLLDLATVQDPTWMPHAMLGRQLVRAEQARQDFFAKDGLPELLGAPDPAVETALRAVVLARAGDVAQAAALLAELPVTPPLTGVCNDVAFEGIADLDDLVAPVLEVLSGNGRYFWVPWALVRELTLKPVERVRDMAYRPAEIDIVDGPNGAVFIPMIYAGSTAGNARLGQLTDWVESDGLARGVGLRCLMVGEEQMPFDEIATLTVAS